MRRPALALTMLAATLALPGAALANPLSFQHWTESWTALTTKDNVRVVKHCQRLHGANDLAFGVCYVKEGMANLKTERVRWERDMKAVVKGQPARCKQAITMYMSAARLKQMASLVY